jgi:GNAT superfamily N-acetyltransferase
MPLPEPEIAESRRGQFLISTDPRRLDLDAIHEFLTHSYWAKGVPREVVERSIEHSLCFGIYDESRARPPHPATERERGAAQVGFARVISDFATIAYVGDVFVLDAYRARGLGTWMMESIVRHPRLQGLRRWILVTRDAHGLYTKFGFRPVKAPESYMEWHRADIYQIGETK